MIGRSTIFLPAWRTTKRLSGVVSPTIAKSSPHLRKMSSASFSFSGLSTMSMRSWLSESIISYAVFSVTHIDTVSRSSRTPRSPFAPISPAEPPARLVLTYDRDIASPFAENVLGFLFLLRLEHHEHALLAFGEHHLVGRHPRLARRHLVEIEPHAEIAFRPHLDRRTGEPG